MDKLFELSAALTLDTAEFIQSLRDSEQSARDMQQSLGRYTASAASSMAGLQRTAASVWQSIAQSIQSAINKTNEFLSIRGSQRIAVFTSSSGVVTGSVKPMATGMPYVPYDNYAARLHEGEAVLTKLEAARWREGTSAPAAVDLSGLASVLAEALSTVAVEMDGQAVGQLVAGSVSRDISQAAHGRRYNP